MSLTDALKAIAAHPLLTVDDRNIISALNTQRAILSYPTTCYYEGHVFFLAGDYEEAIRRYKNAMESIPPCSDRVKEGIELEILEILKMPAFASTLSKEAIVQAIKLLPDDEALPLINNILSNWGILGKTMWTPRWFTPCNLEKGTLKIVVDLKSEIEKRSPKSTA